jgi:hypothetical protein
VMLGRATSLVLADWQGGQLHDDAEGGEGKNAGAEAQRVAWKQARDLEKSDGGWGRKASGDQAVRGWVTKQAAGTGKVKARGQRTLGSGGRAKD